MRKTAITIISVAIVTLVSACTGVKESKPEVTPDGLHLAESTEFSTVYRKPGTDLSAYKKLGVTDCYVAFQNDWLRDQNTKRLNKVNRVSQEVADQITATLSNACKTTFTDALTQPPAYDIVETFRAGEKVLILRPSIIDLYINTPTVKSASPQDNYTTNFGELTLFLELLDGSTEEPLVRIIERRTDSYGGLMWWSNNVANKIISERVLQNWASQLREELDRAMNSPQ